MPSHLTPEDERPESVSILDLKGNEQADKYAGKMADDVTVPLHVSAPITYHYNLIKWIQKRLTTIVTYLPNRKYKRPPPSATTPKPSLEFEKAKSQHVLFRDGSRIKCSRCLNSFSAVDNQVVQFVRSCCAAIGSCVDKPIPLHSNILHIGNQTAHHSHKLLIYKGLVYCNKCGMRGVHKFHNLSRQCNPPTTYGKVTKEAVAQGKLPPLMTHWPDEQQPPAAKKVTRAAKQQVTSSRRIGLPYPGEPIAPINPVLLPIGFRVQTPLRREREIGDTHPPNPYPLVPANNPLVDLVELHAVGEKVVWPVGYNAIIASRFLEDYKHAVSTAYLYTGTYWTPPAPAPTFPVSSLQISRRIALEGIHPDLRSGPSSILQPLAPCAPPLPFLAFREELPPPQGGATEFPDAPQAITKTQSDIIKWSKPAPKISVAPKRRCLSLKEYNARQLGMDTPHPSTSGGSSSTEPADATSAIPAEKGIVPVSCFDPDAPFMEEDD